MANCDRKRKKNRPGRSGSGLGYAALWEGGQLWLTGAGLADSLVDAAAVTFGAALIAGAWDRRRGVLGAAMVGLAAMLVAGVGRRGK